MCWPGIDYISGFAHELLERCYRQLQLPLAVSCRYVYGALGVRGHPLCGRGHLTAAVCSAFACPEGVGDTAKDKK